MNKDSNKDDHQESHKISDASNSLKTPGQLLREQRLKLAMDAKQAADHLKITCTKLKAIEEDNYETFSSSLYVRGHLRNYARLVNISDSEIMDCYYAHIDSNPHSHPSKIDKVDDKVVIVHNPLPLMTWRWPYFVAAGIILLWIIAYPFVGQDKLQQSPGLEGSAVFEDPTVAEVLGGVVHDSMKEVIDNVNIDDNDADVSIYNDINDHSLTAQSASTIDSISEPQGKLILGEGSKVAETQSTIEVLRDDPAAEIDQLVLSFNDDCWLEVTDAEGKILATKLHRAGDRLVLRGTAPFSIMLGNVKAAEVSLNGKAIAVTPIGSRRTLRFMVDNT